MTFLVFKIKSISFNCLRPSNILDISSTSFALNDEGNLIFVKDLHPLNSPDIFLHF